MSNFIFLFLLNILSAKFANTPIDYVMIIAGVILGSVLAVVTTSNDRRKRLEQRRRIKH